MTITTKKSYDEAVSKVQAAAMAYYETDSLEIDDPTYDALLREIADTEIAHPEWSVGASTSVAAGALSGGDITHSSKMLSLDNAMDSDELATWFKKITSVIGATAPFVVEPKLDGLAISATYIGGVLHRAATRGDGASGDDVTERAKTIAGLPVFLAQPLDIELRGEVLMTNDDYTEAQSHRAEYGKPEFTNRRSAAAGGLRNSNLEEVVPLTFSCYGAYGVPEVEGDHSDAMDFVRSLGVTIARGRLSLDGGIAVGLDAILDTIAYFEDARNGLAFEIDGAVIKANRQSDRTKAGEGSKAPKWAIAFKYPAEERLTTLINVNWQVGRTGVITPRAEITPTEVGGVIVTFATMHNVDHISRNGWRIGDTVGIRRAGDVVPELLAPLLEQRADTTTYEIELPTVCPQCGADIDKSQARWRCSRGRACGAVEAISYAVSRDALDIEGMGSKLVEQLVKSGRVLDVADLFTLTVADLTKLDRMGETSAQNVIAQIEVAKGQPLARFITALGIRGTGRSLSRRLSTYCGRLKHLLDISATQLTNVDGIGTEKAALIVDEIDDIRLTIEKLISLGFDFGGESKKVVLTESKAPNGPDVEGIFDGKTIVVTGSMTGALAELSRNEMNELIESCGAKSSSSVSKNTSFVVAGDGAGSKLSKANELGIKVYTPDEFAKMVGL